MRRAFFAFFLGAIILPLAVPPSDVLSGGRLRRFDEVSLTGETLIKTDVYGRIVVVIDRREAGSPPDGRADDLFLFTPEVKSDEYSGLWIRMSSAHIRHQRGRLVVTSPDGGVLLDLSVKAESKPPKSRAAIRMRKGIELIHHRRDFGVDIEEVSTEEFGIAAIGPGVGVPLQSCQAGGRGSRGCSIDCGFEPISSACEVDCREGYYACGNCLLFVSDCRCIEEQ